MKAIAIFESGKTLHYEMSRIDLMIMKSEIIKTIERQERLGINTDRLVSFEIIK